MTESIDRAAIKARAEAATPGPWWGGGDRSKRGGAHPYGLVGRVADRGTGNAIAVLSGVGMDRVADAEFIAHAREDIPALLAALEEAERERDDLEARLAVLLCDLTDGRMSGTGYDVRTMVLAVEEAFDRAQQAEIRVYANAAVEAERRIAAVEDAIEKHRHWNEACGWDVPVIEVRTALDAALHPVAETTYAGEGSRKTTAKPATEKGDDDE